MGNYDHARPLVIDPVILYGTYFGGNGADSIVDLKLGSDGSIFLLITGDSTDLKTVGAPANICNGTCGPTNPGKGETDPDIYVAKLDSTGQTLLFATYLGGSDDDEAMNLALDSDGSVYIAGFSHSQDFPIVNGYPGGAPGASSDPAGTLSKLSADGSTLLYPTAFATANNCPATLNKNDSCKISVSFTPGATGNEFTAALDVKLSTGDVNVVLNGGTNPSDFVLSTTAPTQSNPNATWTLNIAPLTVSIGFNEPITFKVTGLDSSYGTPVFTPSTVTPKGATVTTKLTLNTSNNTALLRGTRSTLPVLACCMAFLLSFRKRLKTYRSRIAAMMIVLALAVFSLSGCAKNPVTFTVTATSGSISHDLTLTLQP
jgi:hypothetical protein